MSRMNQWLVSVFAVACLSATAHAAPVDVNGGASWTGWTKVGNSLDNGIWARGNNLAFDVYTTRFTYAPGSINFDPAGTRGSDNLSTLTLGNSILGLGFAFSNPTQGLTDLPSQSSASAFFKFDFGAIGYAAASSFGASDGRASGTLYAGAGDFNIQVNGIQGSGQERDGAPNTMPVYTGIAGAFNQTPLGASSPIVGFMRNGIGYQLLIDEDAFEALYPGTAADFASAFRVVIAANGPIREANNTEAFISFAASNDVPVPGTLALAGLALAGAGIVARRRRA